MRTLRATLRAALRATTVATVLTLAVVLPAGAALASCAMDERPLEQQVAEAQVVFVGTVVGLQDQQRTALFDVQEVWSGPEMDRRVVVRGGPGDPNMGTSVDRSWQHGRRYLVMPYIEAGQLHDNSCTPTRPWEDRLAAARPADFSQPDAEAMDADGAVATATSTLWIIVGITVLAVGVAGAFVVARRR